MRVSVASNLGCSQYVSESYLTSFYTSTVQSSKTNSYYCFKVKPIKNVKNEIRVPKKNFHVGPVCFTDQEAQDEILLGEPTPF